MNRMQCPINHRKEVLLDYISGRLPAEARSAVETHAVDCPPCQEFLAEQGALWSTLDSFESPAVSGDFDKRLYARIASQEKASFWWKVWQRIFESGEPWSWRPAIAASAVFAIVMAVVLIRPVGVPHGNGGDATKVESIRSAGIDVPDVEAVEAALEDLEMLKLGTGSSI